MQKINIIYVNINIYYPRTIDRWSSSHNPSKPPEIMFYNVNYTPQNELKRNIYEYGLKSVVFYDQISRYSF